MAKGPPPPAAPPVSTPSPRLEWAVGLGALLLYLLATDLGALLRGQVNSFGALLPAEKGIRGIYEMVYQMPPMLKMSADVVRDGIFPAWTPLPEGGTPLMGKMQNGVFNPLHIPLYVLPLSWLPYLFTLFVILRSSLAYAATFFFGRRVGLSPWTAAAAALVFAGLRSRDGLFASGTSAALVPLALYVIERYVQGERRLAPWLAPWAVALPLFGGHFEIALRNGAACAAYAWLRLRAAEPPGRRLAAAWPLAAGAAAGALLAAFQAHAGQDYLNASYNQVWRSLPEFGWWVKTCLKPLRGADVPALGLGWAAVLAGGWLLRKPGLARLASVPLLAGGLAALGLVGLDDPLHFAFRLAEEGLADWVVGPAVLALGAYAALRDDAPASHRALGWLAAGSLAVMLKLPPLSTLLVSLPIVGLLNNTVYQPELELAKLILAGAALEAGLVLARRPWAERRQALAGPLIVAACVAAAVALAEPARSPLSRVLRTHASSLRLPPDAGGFETPHRVTTYLRSQPFSGWIKGTAPASAKLVALRGDQPAAFVDVPIEPSGAGWRFHGVLPLADGVGRAALEVRLPDGKAGVLPGPEINLRTMPRGGFLAAAASFVGAAAIPALGPAGPVAAAAGLAAFGLVSNPMPTVPAEDFPYRLPGLNAVREDPGLFRVGSLSPGFLSADYLALYGLHDSRNGGDNLDPLPSIYFQFFARGQLDEPKTRKLGLGLLSLANVKYLLEPPESELKDASLESVYRGPEMAVYRNRGVRPRALFFDRHVVLPLGDLKDWRNRGKVFGALSGVTSQEGFSPEETLLLNEAPSPASPNASAGTAKEPAVAVKAYRADSLSLEIDTPRPGFVFVSDNLLPGWTAELNGQPVRILRSWVTFRAVAVPAGRSKLEFSYRPLRLHLLALIALLTAWAWALGLLAARPWARTPPPPAPKRGPPPAPPVPAWGGGERLLAGLAAADVLFWTCWAAVRYEGGLAAGLPNPGVGLLVNLLAAGALVAMLALAARSLRRPE